MCKDSAPSLCSCPIGTETITLPPAPSLSRSTQNPTIISFTPSSFPSRLGHHGQQNMLQTSLRCPLPPPPALPVSCLTLVPQNRVFSLDSLCGCCSEPEPEGAFQNISSISPPLKTQPRSFLSASETKPQTFPRGARAFPVPHPSVDFYPITRLCPFPHAALTRKDNFLPFFFPSSSANSS